MAQRWSERLWESAAGIYAAILAHPFLAGLTSGSLPRAAFIHYLAQDAHFLRDFARALMLLGGKAPLHTDTAMLARHADAIVGSELELHSTLLGAVGLTEADLDGIGVAPATQAYTSYLLAATGCGTFAEGLAAVLPCYWIYARAGRELSARGSPDPSYQRWIDTYADQEFAASLAGLIALADRAGPGLAAPEAARAARHFVTAARYEWMFWDAAWRQEDWPV